MKIRISEIYYDIGDTDANIDDLPKELEMEVPRNEYHGKRISDLASEHITKVTGFCHEGFTWEVI